MSITVLQKHEGTFEFERLFYATKEQLFHAYTNERMLKAWWAPEGWVMNKCKISLKDSGYWHFSLKCKDKNNEAYGFETWGLAKYETIKAPQFLAYYDYVSDKQGRINRQVTAPLVEIHFLQVDENHAKLSIKMSYPAAADLERVLELGLEQALEEAYTKLDQALQK